MENDSAESRGPQRAVESIKKELFFFQPCSKGWNFSSKGTSLTTNPSNLYLTIMKSLKYFNGTFQRQNLKII